MDEKHLQPIHEEAKALAQTIAAGDPGDFPKKFPLIALLYRLHQAPGDWDTASELFWDINLNPEETISWLSTFAFDYLKNVAAELRSSNAPDEMPEIETVYPYVHIAAARAVALLRAEGSYTEACVEAFESSLSAASRRYGTYSAASLADKLAQDAFDSDGHPPPISFVAVLGIVFHHLSIARKLDGRFDQSIEFFAAAVQCLGSAWESLPTEHDAGHAALARNLGESLARFAPNKQNAVDAFESLWASPQDRSWAEVAAHCRMIAQWGQFINEHEEFSPYGVAPSAGQETIDAGSEEWTWPEYWAQAHGKATARARPSELAAELRRLEEDRSQDRLSRYAFGDGGWDRVPDRAKRALVSAEMTWFSNRVSRLEGVLNDLRIAFEEILEELVIVPFRTWQSTQAGSSLADLRFAQLELRRSEANKDPNLHWQGDVLGLDTFRGFLVDRGIEGDQLRFITRTLPAFLHDLAIRRAKAEHQIGYSSSRSEADVAVRQSLGLGGYGYIQMLLTIARRLETDE
ncbi:MAG: hypothetical protein O3B84_05365 [Chloroflexi bacterium]|nr:hypothetical protein [Chloroflexota bacterium]